jgi:predicted RNA-binding Zn-ribbon protein involved in translation (DUF1610 family)
MTNSSRDKFNCPSCKTNRHIEVVCSDAVFTEQIGFLDSASYFETTGEIEVHNVGTHRFQCATCGHVIADDLDSLEEWLASNEVVRQLAKGD